MATAPTFAFNRKRQFFLVWSGDDRVAPMHNGEPILVPATTEVAYTYEERKGSPFRFGSAVGRDGKKIPGTVVLEDITDMDPNTGGLRKVFDAEEWCKGIFSNKKPLFERGFTIVDDTNDIEPARAAGRPKWEAKKAFEWRSILAEERRRIKKAESNGEPYTESSSHAAVLEAQEGLMRLSAVQQQRAVSVSEIDKLIGIPSAPVAAAQVVETAPAVPDITVGQIADALYKTAKDNKVSLLKEELVGLLERDEAVMDSVTQKLESQGIEIDLGA